MIAQLERKFMDDLLQTTLDDIELDSSMEESEEDNSSKVDFNDAVVWGTDWTIETIAGQIEKNNIDLKPAFQRRDAWTDKEKSLLIESLMLGIPVPPIILAEKKGERNKFIVIDGKQRLISIYRFYQGRPQEDKAHESDDDSENDIMRRPLQLSGLEYLKELNGKKYEGIDDHYISNIDNQTLRTIVIKNWPNEDFLYTVFLRLNTGSKKLSPQELRQALIPGKFLSFLDVRTSNSDIIKKMLNNSRPDPRMRDVELALRFYAFKYNLEGYNGNLRNFLDYTCKMLNANWDKKQSAIENDFLELENSIAFSYELIDPNYPFSRHHGSSKRNQFNRCMYELYTFFFSDESIRNAVKSNKDVFVKGLNELKANEAFNDAVVATPKSVEHVISRFQLFYSLLEEIPGIDFSGIHFNGIEMQDSKIHLL